jgi:hypothetical protein
MYFRNIPNIQYDTKPISYPFTESEFVLAKNFFKRYKVSEDVFSFAVYFKKYAIQDGERPDTIAEKAYGDPFLDWVIILTNNLINPTFDWPISSYNLQKNLEYAYDNPYGTIKHYRTNELVDSAGITVLKAGLIVDETFFNNTNYKYFDSGLQQTVSIRGDEISIPITVFEYEEELNERNREIYLLKPEYLEAFIKDFRKGNRYKKSTDYIDPTTKKTSV